MTVFIIRRLLQSVIVVFAMTLIVFFGVNVIGNPVDILINPDCDQVCYQAAMKALGLDLPIHEQYLVFLKNALKGDLGKSFILGIPALKLIVSRLPATIELAGMAMVMTLLFGIPLGLWAGLKPHSTSGRTIMAASILGFSLPTFWVGLMMIMVFSVELGWLPPTGRGDTVTVLGLQFSFLTLDGLSHMILPATNLALFHIALVTRLTRSGVRETMLMDFIKFARAKGVGPGRVIFVHVLKNILIPIVTVLGLEIGGLLAFAVVTESIFAWPGMGKLLIESITLLDRPVIVGYLMLIVFLFVLINLTVDILYSALDPRVRVQGSNR